MKVCTYWILDKLVPLLKNKESRDESGMVQDMYSSEQLFPPPKVHMRHVISHALPQLRN